MLKRKALIVLGVSILVLAVVQGQQKATKSPSLTPMDYFEIQQLYARYSHGFDSAADNGNMFARAFTSDGVFNLPNGIVIEGQHKLAEFAARPGNNKGPTNVFHVVSNVLIEPAPEGATGLAYVELVNIGQAGKPSALTGGGIYRDVFVKGPEGWRIK